jgi:2-C-methyl-D-erythritol 2,4-cyclodiphosphate synthase
MRVGLGYDIHRLEEGRPLVLGGINVPFEKGLAGHSDGDALAHAIIDAVLGAAALGDIGRHFPDTSPRYRDADSLGLLVHVVRLVTEAGYRIAHVDANIIAERPKLSPYVDSMRSRLAECLGVGAGQVSVKAKTNEGVGPEGRGEAIRAQAVVLLERVRA